LHRSHSFAIDNDYGHAKYLDKFQNERFNMVKALEKLDRRVATVMFEQKQWFTWIKQCQEKEDEDTENESKKVKLESLLIKHHQTEISRHMREMRSREDGKRQEQYLNAIYTQRLSELSEEEQDYWDPIQDIFGYERDNYVDLIKFFHMFDDEDRTSLSSPRTLTYPTRCRFAATGTNSSSSTFSVKTNTFQPPDGHCSSAISTASIYCSLAS
jgi:hypothetical protein